MKRIIVMLLILFVTVPGFAGGTREVAETGPVILKFFFPVGVAGPQARLMSDLVNQFNVDHDGIAVEAVYSGNYDQTLQRAITASQGGNPPAVIVGTALSMLELLDMGMIEDMDQFMVGADAQYDGNFYPGFMANSQYNGKTWSMPFMRSIPIFYWNKEHFREVGLDPSRAPRNWAEVTEFAQRLAIHDARGEVVRYGYTDITEDSWTITALILQAGGRYSNDEGNEAYFNTPAMRAAFEYWDHLANDLRVMPRQRFYGPAAQDFAAGATSMMVNSPGSFAFVHDAADFEFGVTTLPCNVECGFPTGGGNLYIFRGLSQREREAAWTFVKWMSSPETAARWAIDTGYIPVNRASYNTEAMIEHMEVFPHFRVFADNLEYAQREMMFYRNLQIRERLRVAIAEILSGETSIDRGLTELQRDVDRILEPYR